MRPARLLIAALALLPALSCATAGARRAQRLDALFSDLHARGLFNGAVVVGRGEAIVWEKGFGEANLESHVPFTTDTPSDGASLAKTLTAALVLQLAHEGRIDLDAPVQRLLPELPYADITLRHLLSHSSGLPVLDYDFFDADLPPGKVRTTEALLTVLAEKKLPLVAAPGTTFEYSSFGYDLAALAAARAAGKPLAAVMDERFFHPLKMTATFLRPARLSEFPGTRTIGFRRDGSAVVVNDVFDYEGFHGGSNLYFSARDLHRWNASFFNGAFLDPESLEGEQQYARVGAGRSGLTLGNWYRNAAGSEFSYAGHLQGFHNEVFRDREGEVSIVYLSNNTMPTWLHHAVVRAANAIAHGKTVAPLQPPAVDEIRKEERPSLAGRWTMSDGETLTIAFTDHLTLERDSVRYRMVQVEPRAFYVPGLDFMIGFARDANHTPARIYISTNFDERWGTR